MTSKEADQVEAELGSGFNQKEQSDNKEVDQIEADIENGLQNSGKSRWERSWPTIACGAGLFSDGYLNNVRGWGSILTGFRHMLTSPGHLLCQSDLDQALSETI